MSRDTVSRVDGKSDGLSGGGKTSSPMPKVLQLWSTYSWFTNSGHLPKGGPRLAKARQGHTCGQTRPHKVEEVLVGGGCWVFQRKTKRKLQELICRVDKLEAGRRQVGRRGWGGYQLPNMSRGGRPN